MSEVSIFGKKWTDLVFEGKNKNYGAYQLRRENGQTTLQAFFIGIFFLGSVCGGGLLLSSFAAKPTFPASPELPDARVIYIDKLLPPAPPKAPEMPSGKPSEPKPNLNNPVIVPLENDPVDVQPNNAAATPQSPATPGTDGTGGIASTPTQPNTGTAVVPSIPAGPYRPGALDVQPKFPGGMEKFTDYIGRHFRQPELDNVTKLTVLVSFVIEIDGSMSDIRVLQNPGNGLDKEAIRVLKSLKTKWAPGMKDGQPVRSVFMLPISVVQ